MIIGGCLLHFALLSSYSGVMIVNDCSIRISLLTVVYPMLQKIMMSLNSRRCDCHYFTVVMQLSLIAITITFYTNTQYFL